MYSLCTLPLWHPGDSQNILVPGSILRCWTNTSGSCWKKEQSGKFLGRRKFEPVSLPLSYSCGKSKENFGLGFTSSQQFCASPKVQNGGAQALAGNDPGRGFFDLDRFEGRVLARARQPEVPKIPTIFVEKSVLSFCLFAIWLVLGSIDFYQNAPANNRGVEGQGGTADGIPRRYYYLIFILSRKCEKHQVSSGHLGAEGMGNKPREVFPPSLPHTRVSGFSFGHCKNENFHPPRKKEALSQCRSADAQKIGKKRCSSFAHLFLCSWEIAEFIPRRSILQIAPAGPGSYGSGKGKGEPKRVRFVGHVHSPSSGGKGGAGLVGGLAQGLERKFDSHSSNQGRPVFGRQRHRVRGVHQPAVGTGGPYVSSRVLGGPREGKFNQSERVACSRESGQGTSPLAPGRRWGGTPLYRQYCDIHLPQQHGGPLSTSSRGSKQDAKILRGQGGKAGSRAPPRGPEHGGRRPLPLAHGQIRLVSQPPNFSAGGFSVGTPHHRLVCNQKQLPASTLRLMGGRREGHLCGRVAALGEKEGKWVRQPPFFGDRKNFAKNPEIGPRFNSHRSSVAVPTLVASTSKTFVRYSPPPPPNPGSVFAAGSGRGALLPAFSALGSIRMQDIGKILQEKGVPLEVIETLCHVWAESTHKNYDAVWKRWRIFCRNRKCDLFDPPPFLALAFLKEEWETYRTASAVNHALSSISGAGQLVTQRALAEIPLIKMYRRAVNTICPPAPAAEDTFDVVLLFRYIKQNMPDNKKLSISDLRMKTVVLLRLDLMSRSSDLAKMFRNQIKWGETSFQVRFYKPKDWRQGSEACHGVWSNWVTVYKYHDISLCTYRALREYLIRTEGKAAPISVEGVPLPQASVLVSLLSRRSDHLLLPVKSGTISDICKELMRKAGVPQRLKPASLRGAAASAALDYGIKESVVCNQARWRDPKMFRKYYYRKIDRAMPRKRLPMSTVAAVLRSAV